MSMSMFLLLLIALFGIAKRTSYHRVSSDPLQQFELTASGNQHNLNKSVAAAAADVIDFSGEVEVAPGFQSSLLDSSLELQRANAEIFEHSSHNVADLDNAPKTFIASNGEADSYPFAGKIIRGSLGNRYKYIRYLGKGTFGEVWSATDEGMSVTDDFEKLKPVVAIKVAHLQASKLGLVLPKARKAVNLSAIVSNEVRAMSKCAGSPYVVRMLDRFHDNNGRCYIVLEFAPGDLTGQIISGKVSLRTPDVLTLIFYDMLRGLAYIHEQGVSHRDMKPDNVLITSGNRAKISDFGHASDTTFLKTTKLGTEIYMSPELHAHAEYLGPEVDVFALGVTLYAMVTGEAAYWQGSLPIRGTAYFPQAHHIKALTGVPKKIKEIIVCTQKENIMCSPLRKFTGNCRCGIADIMQMTWIQDAVALDPPLSMDRSASEEWAGMLNLALIHVLLVHFYF